MGVGVIYEDENELNLFIMLFMILCLQDGYRKAGMIQLHDTLFPVQPA